MTRVPPELDGHAWAPPENFLGVPVENARWEGARTVILPVPYEATTSYGPGTREGPRSILQASRYVELYDEELDAEPHERGIHTLPPLELTSAGPGEAVAELRDLYDRLLDASGERFVVMLGGEHSLSSAPVVAWADRLEGDLSVLQFDAHSDLRESYHGTPWNHACVMRRILERDVGVVGVGIRALTAEERAVIRDRELVTVFAEELRGDGWVEKALAGLSENVYVTFDVDFFDPSLLPATGTPEPGGGGWWEALDLLRAVFRERNVVGADVVELSPRPDEAASGVVAAKLVYKMIGYRLHL